MTSSEKTVARDIHHRLVEDFGLPDMPLNNGRVRDFLEDAISKVLSGQREQDAKIAEKHAMQYAKPVNDRQEAADTMARVIADAIRKGQP